MNRLEKALCRIIGSRESTLELYMKGVMIGALRLGNWLGPKMSFFEGVECNRNNDGTYSLWIANDGIESFYHLDSFRIEEI